MTFYIYTGGNKMFAGRVKDLFVWDVTSNMYNIQLQNYLSGPNILSN